MAYRLVTKREDYRDLASGSVLRSAPGYPAYPVRLAQELFLRAVSYLTDEPIGLWDPCCGSGYLATVIGLLHRDRLRYVIASDVAPEAVTLAARNLALLTQGGLAARADELRARQAELGKPGYGSAAEAATRLTERLSAAGGDLSVDTGVADAFDSASLAAFLPVPPPDLVLADLPYGRQTTWTGSLPPEADPTQAMLRALCAVLPDHAIITLTTQARKVPLPPGVRPLERLRVGTRAGFIGRVGQIREHV